MVLEGVSSNENSWKDPDTNIIPVVIGLINSLLVKNVHSNFYKNKPENYWRDYELKNRKE